MKKKVCLGEKAIVSTNYFSDPFENFHNTTVYFFFPNGTFQAVLYF